MSTDTTEDTSIPFASDDLHVEDYNPESTALAAGETVGDTTEEPVKERDNGRAPYWRVPSDKIFKAVKMKDDTWRLRCLWSEKLGMQLEHPFQRCEHAESVIDEIVRKGWLETKCWAQVFQPSEDFLEGDSFEKNLVKF